MMKTQSMKELMSSLEGAKDTREVFGKYLYEGELGILFGDSNAGKSILANDICFFVSGGGHAWNDMVSPNIPSMYIDMEMTGKQYANRYSNALDYIPDSFSRAEVSLATSTEDTLFNSVCNDIVRRQCEPNPPKFIVIDNITSGFGSIYSANQMKDIMFSLKSMKVRFGLTILLVAHCPKRKKAAPITDNNLGGSKMLINFCDSAFAIGASMHSEETKYIKQIKTREGKKQDKVMTVKISDEPFLSMQFVSMDDEDVHIKDLMGISGLPLSKERELKRFILENREQFSWGEIMNRFKINWNSLYAFLVANDIH